jgi:uncharacterized membrane protein (DUF485 family)
MTDAARNGAPAVDWTAIERMPEFQELVTGRRRFAWAAGGIGIGLGVVYVVLVATAHDLMGTRLAGSFSVGFAGGVGLVLLTWAITLTYMRRSDRLWGPLEARVRERALAARVPEPVLAERELAVAAGAFGHPTDTVLATQEARR